MTASTRPRPPALARRLLAAVLPASVAGRSTAGDLIEEFHRRPSGWRRRVWFWTATVDLVARYVPGRIAGLLASFRRDLAYAMRAQCAVRKLQRRHPPPVEVGEQTIFASLRSARRRTT